MHRPGVLALRRLDGEMLAQGAALAFVVRIDTAAAGDVVVGGGVFDVAVARHTAWQGAPGGYKDARQGELHPARVAALCSSRRVALAFPLPRCVSLGGGCRSQDRVDDVCVRYQHPGTVAAQVAQDRHPSVTHQHRRSSPLQAAPSPSAAGRLVKTPRPELGSDTAIPLVAAADCQMAPFLEVRTSGAAPAATAVVAVALRRCCWYTTLRGAVVVACFPSPTSPHRLAST